MSDSNVAARLKFFMDSKEISITQFADMCGIPRPTLSQLLSGRNKKLSDVIVKLIHDRFPELSVLWLMFGEGEMLVPAPINPTLVSEAEKFLDALGEETVNQNLSASNTPQITPKTLEKQSVKGVSMNVNSANEIAPTSLPPRRVRSITIFYDDNSYEVFVPVKK